jgi:hypothetical protein
MFIRKKPNKSGAISVQVIEKRDGKSVLVKTVGSSRDAKEIEDLVQQGKRFINLSSG